MTIFAGWKTMTPQQLRAASESDKRRRAADERRLEAEREASLAQTREYTRQALAARQAAAGRGSDQRPRIAPVCGASTWAAAHARVAERLVR